MANFVKFVMVAGLLVVLAGCASLSKSECEVGDWYNLGKTDGYNGASSLAKMASYNEACNEHGIYVDQNRYNEGHAAGLIGYCTLPRGVSEGTAGREYGGVCVGEPDFEFRRGHDIGMERYTITSRIQSLRRDISVARAEQKKHPPNSADYYRLDGDIRVANSEINSLSVQQGQVQQRIDDMLAGY